MAIEGNSLSSNNHCSTHQPSNGGPSHSMTTSGYSQNTSVSGWAYSNEHGQMCGPYIQEQLSEGLSTGFLPADLPVYPIINGSLMNPIALKHIGQLGCPAYCGTSGFPITVSQSSASHNILLITQSRDLGSTANYSPLTAYVRESANQIQVSHGSCVSGTHVSNMETGNHASIGLLSRHLGEESRWTFEDERGRKHGHHSLAELYHWHHSDYLHGSLKVTPLIRSLNHLHSNC